MLQELRFALRALRRRPFFAAVAFLTLALGIGSSATIASVLNTVVLRALPYAEPERLVLVWSRWTAFEKTWLSELELFDYQREARTLAHVGAWTDTAVNLTGSGEPERVRAAAVSASLFHALGTPALLGRTFAADEDRPGQDTVVVLSHALWRRRFAADPSIVGRDIQVDGVGRMVVGVMPAGFVLPLDFTQPDPTDIWMPLAIDEKEASRGSHYLYSVARLAPGMTPG